MMDIHEEETHTKGINNLVNNAIGENFPNLGKEATSRYRRLSEHQTGILYLKH
jgi:hypothetical protein